LQAGLFAEPRANSFPDSCNFDHPTTPQKKRTVSFAGIFPEPPAKKVQHLPPPSNNYVYAVFQDVLTESYTNTHANGKTDTVAIKKSEKENTRDVLGVYTTITKANAKASQLVKEFKANENCGQAKTTVQEDGRIRFQFDQGKHITSPKRLPALPERDSNCFTQDEGGKKLKLEIRIDEIELDEDDDDEVEIILGNGDSAKAPLSKQSPSLQEGASGEPAFDISQYDYMLK
jgi:translation initiation factor 1 (eIF-1/SUI1)